MPVGVDWLESGSPGESRNESDGIGNENPVGDPS